MTDLPVSSDGNCIVCDEPKKAPARVQKGVGRHEYLDDPYCSRVCCEKDHGIEPSAVRKDGAPRRGMEHGTEAMYTSGRCRCEPCRQAATQARRRRRGLAEEATIRDRISPTLRAQIETAESMVEAA